MCALVTGVQTCALPIEAFALDAVAQGEFEVLRGSRLSQVAVDQRHLLARHRDQPAERQSHGGLTLTRDGRRHQEDARRSIDLRSEEHTSELQSLMRISYAVF